MIQVDESYFQDEEIQGFTVKAMMKRFWYAELEVLQRFDQICETYGLTYYACWGTLIGAIRHGGFIPWDDDIDLAMPRADFEKLRSIMTSGMITDLTMIADSVFDGYDNLTARIVNDTSIATDPERMKRYHGCPYIAGLDIDILDKKADSEHDDDLQMEMIELVLQIADLGNKEQQLGTAIAELDGAVSEDVTEDDIQNAKASYAELREQIDLLLGQLHDMLNITVPHDEQLIMHLHTLALQLAQIYEEDDTQKYQFTYHRVALNKKAFCFDRFLWEKTIRVPFGPLTIPVPWQYNKVLTQMFGPGYVTPINRRGAHDYPVYKGQEEQLKEYLVARHLSGERFGIDC